MEYPFSVIVCGPGDGLRDYGHRVSQLFFRTEGEARNAMAWLLGHNPNIKTLFIGHRGN